MKEQLSFFKKNNNNIIQPWSAYREFLTGRLIALDK